MYVEWKILSRRPRSSEICKSLAKVAGGINPKATHKSRARDKRRVKETANDTIWHVLCLQRLTQTFWFLFWLTVAQKWWQANLLADDDNKMWQKLICLASMYQKIANWAPKKKTKKKNLKPFLLPKTNSGGARINNHFDEHRKVKECEARGKKNGKLKYSLFLE